MTTLLSPTRRRGTIRTGTLLPPRAVVTARGVGVAVARATRRGLALRLGKGRGESVIPTRCSRSTRRTRTSYPRLLLRLRSKLCMHHVVPLYVVVAVGT